MPVGIEDETVVISRNPAKDFWTIKAWPMPGTNQEFKHVRNQTWERVTGLKDHYNKLGYGVVAVVRQRGSSDD